MKKICLVAFGALSSFIASLAVAGDGIVNQETFNRVPEPGTLALLALGVAGIAAVRLRGRK